MATLKLGSTTAISESSGAITYDAGTIGSNIVFPAGHVVKTVFGTKVTAEDAHSADTWAATGLSVTIDPIFNNSTILITHQWTYHWNAQNGNCKGKSIIKNDTAGTYVQGSMAMHYRRDTGTSNHYGNKGVYLFAYETLSTGAAQTYQLYARAISGTFYYFNASSYGTGAEDTAGLIMAQEIKN